MIMRTLSIRNVATGFAPKHGAAPRKAPLSREMSLFLDLVRFSAALVVFFGHFATRDLSGGVFWRIAPFRHDAVIVFFVLSGFVIAYAVSGRERDPRTYLVNRMARIYSVVLPAIALTLICDAIGNHFDPGHYTTWSYSPGALWQQLASSLTFTNQLWNFYYFPGSDGPFWSLGYEVPYYAIFACAIFARKAWRFILPAALLALAGPTIAALFPIWLAGVALQRFTARATLSETAGWVLFIGSIAFWALTERWALASDAWIFHTSIPFLARERLPADYLTGLCFCAAILGFSAIAHRFTAPLAFAARAIRWTAGGTFTLYLLHYPILKLCVTLCPWGVSASATRIISILATAILVLVWAQLFERRKEAWRRAIDWMLSPEWGSALTAARSPSK
jgi:peptidoglycan/LPS O-acetylase OafA/YrhL